MSGKYLRKRVPGKSMDPTMTYMDDPHVVKVGDFIRDAYGYDRVVTIDEAKFDNPDIRFAHLIEIPDSESVPEIATVHDVRAMDEEKHQQWMSSMRMAK